MLLIDCPYCKEMRPEVEFSHAGEAHIDRPADPSSLSDEEWESFLFLRSNRAGICFERWYHIHGCGRYFNAVRNNVSEKFILTYPAGQKRPSDAQIKGALS
ncbi:MAG: sarcosine oxidase subunit delta [Devosiaceae bacterium]|nr:sarcosine oxidase subunit delta [Devosiaceae bacterium]